MRQAMNRTGTRANTPESKHLQFTYNPETKYFDLAAEVMGFNKVPAELKIEQTQKKDQVGSEYLIRSRIRDGKYLFFTGIRKTKFNNWYYGDFYEIRNGIKKNSFILFHFTQDQTAFEMYFFNHFKLYPNKRDHFTNQFIHSL